MTQTLELSEAAALVHTARRFVDAWSVRQEAGAEKGPEARRALVSEVAELGWPQLLVTDDGVLTLGNAPIVSDILKLVGAALLPDILTDAVATTPVFVAACGATARELVGDLTDGSRLVASAVHGDGEDGCPLDDPFAAVVVDAGVVHGTKVLVRDGVWADGFVVTGRRPAGQAVVAWVQAGDGLVIEAQRSIDPATAPARVRFDGARAEVLAEGAAAERAVRLAMAVTRMVVVSEIAGLSENVTLLSAEYARSRVQFGRAIGSFQAIKHLLADLWRETYQADCVREEVALRLGDSSLEPDDVDLAAASAKAWSGRFVQRCVEAALQIHGGYGFTAEGPLSGYYLRALTLANTEGTPRGLALSIGAQALQAARS